MPICLYARLLWLNNLWFDLKLVHMTYQRPLLNFTALVIVLLPNMSNGQIGYILWSIFLLVQMPYVSPLQLEHIIFDTQHVTVGKNGQIGYISCCCGFMVSGFCFGFCSDPDCPGQAGSKKNSHSKNRVK